MPDAPAPAPSHPAVDEAGILISDVPCRSCSYNLRGLHRDSDCPECATEIQLCLRGNLLYCSDPDWVEKLKIGSRILFFWAVLMILLMCLSSPLGLLTP